MNILCIDTSTSYGVLSLSENENTLAEISFSSNEMSSSKLLPTIEWLCKSAGVEFDAIDGFGITLGPGSFTGLRIGLATIKGFAWAKQKPVVGISPLEALAFPLKFSPFTIVPMMDARRGRVYGAGFRWNGKHLELVFPPSDLQAHVLVSKIDAPMICLGQGARKYKDEIMRNASAKHIQFAPLDCDIPHEYRLF